MVLSETCQREMTEPMREGLLFEGYLFNKFKNDDEEELKGRKQKKTIDAIKAMAGKVSKILVDGESFYRIEVETETRIYQGEIDYLGIIILSNGKEFDGIVDIKKTGSLDWVWEETFADKLTYLQGSFYPYLLWLKTGVWKDFCYVIIEDKYTDPIISYRVVRTSHCQDEVKEYYESLFKQIEQDIVKPATPSPARCLKPYRCPYLEFCEEGRALLEGVLDVDWTDLKSPMKPNWAEIEYYSNQAE